MVKGAFTITSELLPAPQWFKIEFRNGWGAYIVWGKEPVKGTGIKTAEVDVLNNGVPTGEEHAWQSPEQVASLLVSLTKRKPV